MLLRPAHHRPLRVAVFCCLAAVATGAMAESPIEQRVQRLERILDNRVLIDLLQRIDGLQREMRQLRGEIELQRNELATMDQRNRDLYIDTDRRLQDLETRSSAAAAQTQSLVREPTALGDATPGVATPGVATPGATTAASAAAATAAAAPAAANTTTAVARAATQPADATAPATSALLTPPEDADPAEKSLFDNAYLDLVNGRYNAATSGFEKLLSQYPNGSYNAGALYWLGEAQYAQRQFESARGYFDQLLVLYPADKKAPDARLKVGFVEHELGDIEAARATLEGVVSRHPRTTAALLAQRRLSEIGE
ncbi:MAG: tol-pal system protein YbgF [Pseudomonadota bacterium]